MAYTRESFDRTAFEAHTPVHYDLRFEVLEDGQRVHVTAITTFVNQSSAPVSRVVLDYDAGTDEEHKSLVADQMSSTGVVLPTWDTDRDLKTSVFTAAIREHIDTITTVKRGLKITPFKGKIAVRLEKHILPGQQFALCITSTVLPSSKCLEGIYPDFTPPGVSSQTLISQCQQYGFRRITPSVDAMGAKALFTTHIETSSCDYKRVLSNGVIVGDDGSNNTFELHDVPMAPYLFFFGAGHWETHYRELEYSSGRKVQLEALVLPDTFSDTEIQASLDMTAKSVLWTNLCTGPERYNHPEETVKRVFELINQRDALKAELRQVYTQSLFLLSSSFAPEHAQNRLKLNLLAARRKLKTVYERTWTKPGYEYTGDVYREIVMQVSNYGGMENVGNTMVPVRTTMHSSRFYYTEQVKVHEFYHNLNGSEVTGESPLDIWINEAVTCVIEEWRAEDLFGKNQRRLTKVKKALKAVRDDMSPSARPILPSSFNHPDELISRVTYVKAPEFVRMVETFIGGPEVFVKGIDLYHTKHRYGNASTDDWLAAMEAVSESKSEITVQEFASKWLGETKSPTLSYRVDDDRGEVTVSGMDGFVVPVKWALVKDSVTVKEGLFIATHDSDTFLLLTDRDGYDFLSFAVGYSFFGRTDLSNAKIEDLELQAVSDPDIVNSYLAYREVVERIKFRSITAQSGGDESYENLFRALWSKFSPDERPAFLTEPTGALASHPELRHRYKDLDRARRALLIRQRQALEAKEREWPETVPSESSLFDLDDLKRSAIVGHLCDLERACVAVPGTLTQKESVVFHTATIAMASVDGMSLTDRSTVMHNMLETPELKFKEKIELVHLAEAWYVQRSDMTGLFLSTMVNLDTDDVVAILRDCLSRPYFDPDKVTHLRPLCHWPRGDMARSIMTDEGLALTFDLFKLAATEAKNTHVAGAVLSAFDDMALIQDPEKTKITEVLTKMKALGDAITPRLHDDLDKILAQL
jgi:aminopeptidase N